MPTIIRVNGKKHGTIHVAKIGRVGAAIDADILDQHRRSICAGGFPEFTSVHHIIGTKVHGVANRGHATRVATGKPVVDVFQ